MVLCEGGEKTNINGYVIHTFKTVGSTILNVIEGGNIEVLVVAGGGGGGNGSGSCEAGGGGAGGLIYNDNYFISNGSISVIVGDGGLANSKGNNSVFGNIIAEGGGNGGTNSTGGAGGSGGGGSHASDGGTAVLGQGNVGGRGTAHLGINGEYQNSGGGGGGAGKAGNTNYPTFGGDGLYFEQFKSVGGSPPGWFAAGGGGGSGKSFYMRYISYGGGGYSSEVGSIDPIPGIPNTGGGGGGRLQCNGGLGASGGSGIIIIRYALRATIPYSGPFTFTDIQNTFGGDVPISISEYYLDATTNYVSGVNGIPNIGTEFPVSSMRGIDGNILPDFGILNYFSDVGKDVVSIAIDSDDNMYFTDNTNNISKISNSGKGTRDYVILRDSNNNIINPIAWYKFDNSAELPNDSSGNGKTLQLGNGSTTSTYPTLNTSDYRKGTGCANFNGSQYFYTTSVPLANISFTMSYWLKHLNAGFYIKQGTSTTTRQYIHFGSRNTNNLAFDFYNTSLETNNFAYGTDWQYLVFTYDMNTNIRTLYRNGIKLLQNMVDGPFIGNSNFYIGIDLIGQLDDFRIYNQALTHSQVSDLYYGDSLKINSTFYNVGVGFSKIAIQENIMYLAYLTYNGNTTWNGTVVPNNYVNLKKITLSYGVVISESIMATKVHPHGLSGGAAGFWPGGHPNIVIANPNGDVYCGINTAWWWGQPSIIKVAANGTKSVMYYDAGDAYSANVAYSMAPSKDSSGIYTIEQSRLNFRNSSGVSSTLLILPNRDNRIVGYISSKIIIFDRTTKEFKLYDINSSSVIETVLVKDVDYREMCASNKHDSYLYDYTKGAILIKRGPNDGSCIEKAALSGWHLAQLNNYMNLNLINGFYWIKSEKMPDGLRMYVNFTADGGGYDFYRMTNANSVNYVYLKTGAEVLGIDLFYPRSKEHWAAIYDFVVNVNGSTILNDVKTCGKIYKIYNGGNYSGYVMRDPRYYTNGAPDWRVPDGGKWFLRDLTFGEPNGDYYGFAYLGLGDVNAAHYTVAVDGTVQGYNDGNANYFTRTTIICSTNFKGSPFDVSTNDGSESNKAALSGWHLAQYSKQYGLNLASGWYWIQSPKMPNPLQMYVNMTIEGGGYDFYRMTNATSVNYVNQNTGAEALGLDMFYPRSREHWKAIYDFVVNVCGSTILNDVKTPGKVYRDTNAITNYTGYLMRDPRYYVSGAPYWRVPDGGRWFIRDQSYSEPNGNYTLNGYLYLWNNRLNADGTVEFDDAGAQPTGTTIICSTNVKGFINFL